jgi:alpha-ketoglutarate-dependent taurine dioxygenase
LAASPDVLAGLGAPGGGDYARWRERKLARCPRTPGELIVEVRDPRALTAAERGAIAERLARANMAVYASRCGDDPDKEIPRALGRQFALERLDPNWLADDDGISSVAVRGNETRGEFIPYTSRAIRWHTDGYYNPPARRIRAFVLHCVRDAAEGGESSLLDHELAYLALRDANPEWIRALMQPQAMTIPGRSEGGEVARAAQSGPVFSFDPRDGALEMRYTARTVSIRWSEDAAQAAAALAKWLDGSPAQVLRLKLGPGMGVICNNVLHARSAFEDAPQRPRLLYRARYYDRARGPGTTAR